MPLETTLLAVDGLKATYNNAITALDGVGFHLARGEILALLGANGAGKTTTLKALSNLLPAERGQVVSGSICFDGLDVLRTSPAALVRAGLVQVLEGRHCFRSLTVEENLVSGGLGRGSTRAEIAEDIEKVYTRFPRLKEKRRALSGLTSGGEQQMTAIGRALMSRPRLLVLDEPSMGLAPLVVQDIFRTLRHLNREEGLSILFAEQNSAIALKYADRAIILENGATVLTGDAQDLRGRDDIKSFYLGKRAVAPSIPAVVG
ncbi:ABC transporter ATP-binding protein (plasmid) [Rhizobium leguminosarum]|jgi:branched-chain amino acid transport system ATP-binding protein|uniref:Branched-chain amino acid ABC transporter ATP-binding protein n=3 Tax=Rhizobium TaxID=379 RepID=A0A1B8R5F2_RHILT|nr:MULTISPECIES: ABC transporter ATP-binding protein [Rhizobium]AOO93207.1 branched-chain amino acid ABC transporter ATP-binding protein [Rhizobium leguminosarum bv. trifolii]OBY04035.1 ABC transporter ATP-binding protein [Rhizobium leguminosarum bv. trifolii]TAU15614.1 ABC transporter ATP-binding protein [Rhizobium ruizarguesonis]TAU37095.1 ABC transporter ATP-binding protein [Rhizobium leguminosarum]TAU37444.1 ABC transporter ATP-binding protein [Rhizobium ruizarguesonis]